MKKIVSTVLVCVLLLSTMLALVSCGKVLSGTYSDKYTGLTTYTFEGNKVTVEAGAGNFKSSVSGTYEIKENDEGKEVIIFTFGEEGDEYSGEFSFVEGSEGDTKYIKIGGVQYNKK